MLLRRYADGGDGESAYGLVTTVMQRHDDTRPNGETYALLLDACMKTERGRYYAKLVLQDLKKGQPAPAADGNGNGNGAGAGGADTAPAGPGAGAGAGLRKEEWDRYLELQVLRSEPYWSALMEMVGSGEQPDDATVSLLMEAFGRAGDVGGALRLHRLQAAAEARRRQMRKDLLGAAAAAAAAAQVQGEGSGKAVAAAAAAAVPESGSQREAMHLPPPSRRTTHCLLELLRDSAAARAAPQSPPRGGGATAPAPAPAPAPMGSAPPHEEARKVLADMMARAAEYRERDEPTKPKPRFQPFPVAVTASGKRLLAGLVSPDQVRPLSNPYLTPIPPLSHPYPIPIRLSDPSLDENARSHPLSSRNLPHNRLVTNATPTPPAAPLRAGQTTFALVMEACLAAGDADAALQTFSRMEEHGLRADRRVYAALVRAFGQRRDVPSALGVFDEMRRALSPDVANLMRCAFCTSVRPLLPLPPTHPPHTHPTPSVLEVCLEDPTDLRLLCGVLEKMADDGCDLEVYSQVRPPGNAPSTPSRHANRRPLLTGTRATR